MDELQQTFQKQGTFQKELIHPEKQKKKSYKNSGIIRFQNFKVEKLPSFVDYIRGGCEINLVVGIDFTASNGSIAQPTSLHYLSKDHPNSYQTAIKEVGDVLINYDTDHKIPVFGFGASITRNGRQTTSHCFAMNENEDNPEVDGVRGILEVYEKTLKNISLSGPTNLPT